MSARDTSKVRHLKNNISYHNSVDSKKHTKAIKSISSDKRNMMFTSVEMPGFSSTEFAISN